MGEEVDVSIKVTLQSYRFQHPVASTYKKNVYLQVNLISLLHRVRYRSYIHLIIWQQVLLFTVWTDTMGRMHSDAQFAGSSSVPAHVEMMGFLVSVTTRW